MGGDGVSGMASLRLVLFMYFATLIAWVVALVWSVVRSLGSTPSLVWYLVMILAPVRHVGVVEGVPRRPRAIHC
jgi:hypothetical protein